MPDPLSDPQTQLEPGEKLVAEWRSDRARFWRDHAIMAGLGALAAGVVLWFTGTTPGGILGGVAGALLAIGARGLYLSGEQLKSVWLVTDRRVILPSGRAVMLAEIETERKLMGDLQLITRSGDKHLVKHLADADAALAQLSKARARRLKQLSRAG